MKSRLFMPANMARAGLLRLEAACRESKDNLDFGVGTARPLPAASRQNASRQLTNRQTCHLPRAIRNPRFEIFGLPQRRAIVWRRYMDTGGVAESSWEAP
jgi:hypothetical protein